MIKIRHENKNVSPKSVRDKAIIGIKERKFKYLGHVTKHNIYYYVTKHNILDILEHYLHIRYADLSYVLHSLISPLLKVDNL